MTRVTKRKIPDELREEAWAQFLKATQISVSPKALRKKLERFLTPAELVLLEKRLAILVLLRHGVSYKKMGRMIDVSPHTVSFVKYNLVRNALRDQIRASRGLLKPQSRTLKIPRFENYSPLAMDYARLKRNQRMYRQR